MSKEQENKAIVARWFEGFWGNPWNPKIVDELAAPDMLLQYSLHAPRRGRKEVKKFSSQASARHFPTSNSGVRRILSRKAIRWLAAGKAEGHTLGPLSAISSPGHCRRIPAGRCISRERRSSV
jgi:hypothetical protein